MLVISTPIASRKSARSKGGGKSDEPIGWNGGWGGKDVLIDLTADGMYRDGGGVFHNHGAFCKEAFVRTDASRHCKAEGVDACITARWSENKKKTARLKKGGSKK